MKLTVLADNNTYIDQYYLAEPALSIYIENSDKKYLFDTGYSDVYLKNAAKLPSEDFSTSMKYFSKSSPRIKPIRKGAAGMPVLLNTKPTIPNSRRVHTSNMLPLRIA